MRFSRAACVVFAWMLSAVLAFGPAAPKLTMSDNSVYFGVFTGFSNNLGTTMEDVVNVGVLAYNQTAWSSINAVFNSNEAVYALTLNPNNGHMFIGGSFSTIAGVQLNNIAEFDGNTFLPLFLGLNGPVYSMAYVGNSLYVGGDFTNLYGTGASLVPSSYNYLAVWSNGQWSSLNYAGVNGIVYALSSPDSTRLFIGGSFSSTGDSDTVLPDVMLTSVTVTSQTGPNNATTILNNPTAKDGPGYAWFLPDYSTGQVNFDLGYDAYNADFTITRIRVANTHYQGKGSRQISFQVDGNIQSVTYWDDVARNYITCTTTCLLSYNSSLPFVDYYLTSTILTGARTVTISIGSYYGSGGGLTSVQIFKKRLLYCYAQPGSVTTSGTWTINGAASDVYGPYYYGVQDSTLQQTLTFHFEVPLDGAYKFYMISQCLTLGNCIPYLSVNVYDGTTIIGTSDVNVTSTVASYFTISLFDNINQNGINLQAGHQLRVAVTLVSPTVGNDINIIGGYYLKVPTLLNLNGFAYSDLTQKSPAVSNLGTSLPSASTVNTIFPLSGTKEVIVGGSFVFIANTSSYENIVKFDYSSNSYTPLGNNGLNGPVNAIVAAPNGDLIVGGKFTFTSTLVQTLSIPLSYIGYYSISTGNWSMLGRGLSSDVNVLQAVNDSIYIGGTFNTAFQTDDFYGIVANTLTSFNLTSQAYVPIGDIYNYHSVSAFLVNGSTVFVAGEIGFHSNIEANGIARYSSSDSAFFSMDEGFAPSLMVAYGAGADGGFSIPEVRAAVYVNQTTLIVGGRFFSQGTYENRLRGLATYINGSWVSVGNGVNGIVNTLLNVNDKYVWIGGSFTLTNNEVTQFNTIPLNGLAVWDGVRLFNPAPILSTGTTNTPVVNCFVHVSDGGVDYMFVGGSFGFAGQVVTRNIALWDGTKWHALGMGTDGPVNSMVLVDNILVVGGSFTTAGGILVNNIAFWNIDDGHWLAIPTGSYPGVNGAVTSIAVDEGINSLFFAGSFSDSYVNHFFAKWDGTNIVYFGNLTSTSTINSIRIAQADNVVSNNWLSDGKVLVAYGYITLNTYSSVNYGSIVFDGYNWIPDTVVFDSYAFGTAQVFGYLEGYASNSGLAAWQIALAVVFSIIGAAILAGLAFFIYKKVNSPAK